MAIPQNLKKGAVLQIEGQPYIVLDYWEARTAQRRTTLHVKLRDVVRGKVVDRTLDDKSEVVLADSQVRVLQYLYADLNAFHFMDVRTFDQLALPRDLVADREKLLKEEEEYKVLFLDGRPILVEFPPTVALEVTQTPEGAGATSGNSDKIATLEGGIEVTVPRFIKVGDRIRIHTETLQYLGKE